MADLECHAIKLLWTITLTSQNISWDSIKIKQYKLRSKNVLQFMETLDQMLGEEGN